MKTLVLFSCLLWESKRWSLFCELELAPLLWLLGIGYEAPDQDAMLPFHKLLVHIPTFRLEFRLAKRGDLEKARVAMTQIEAAT